MDLFRPRDEFDLGVSTESLRGKALAMMDTQAAVTRALETAIAALPWWKRYPARAALALAWGWVKLVGRFGAMG